MKIAVIGATGQLGSMVCNILSKRGHRVSGFYRDIEKLRQVQKMYSIDFNHLVQFNLKEWDDGRPTTQFFNDCLDAFKTHTAPYDYVVNCAGVIKPESEKDVPLTYTVNGVFPRVLAQAHPRVIHVTTDCVFAGNQGRGAYTERDIHDCTDTYGLSKSLGDSAGCLTVRTSIIGPEVVNHRSLLSWFIDQAKQQKEKGLEAVPINGYDNHNWNGLTTKQLSLFIASVIEKSKLVDGVRHLYGNPVTKYEMLNTLNEVLDLKAVINKVSAAEGIDRTLSTEYNEFRNDINNNRFIDMAQNMAEDCMRIYGLNS
jgi:dTDP-4-dehydrorhamnose reductase